MPNSSRIFFKIAAITTSGITIAPNSILGKSHGHLSQSDKLNIAGTGYTD